MTLPREIAQIIQSPEPGEIVHMYELDTSILGGPVYRFTSSALESGPVVFGGYTYAPIPCQTDGWEMTGKGTVPRPRLRVANVNGLLSQAINEFGDLVNCRFRRIRTFRRFLDGQLDADPNKHWPIDIYRIEQKSNQNKVFVEWTLAAAFDQQGRELPGRQIIQRTCTHRYRRWDAVLQEFDYSKATCPYTGDRFYDTTGAVTSADNDQCSKLLKTGCILRFGKDPLPTRAFPGVGRSSLGGT